MSLASLGILDPDYNSFGPPRLGPRSVVARSSVNEAGSKLVDGV